MRYTVVASVSTADTSRLVAMSIEERLCRLERANRRLRWYMVALFTLNALVLSLGRVYGLEVGALAGLLAVICALALGVGLEWRVPRILRARKIEIIGERGTVVVAVGETTSGAGAVATYSSQGKTLAHMGADTGSLATPSPADISVGKSPAELLRSRKVVHTQSLDPGNNDA